MDEIKEFGSSRAQNIHCLTIVGQVEGHQLLPEDVKTYLDISLKRFDTVFPAVGSAASAIELTCDELQTCCGPNFVEWVDVCKGWQEEA